MTKCPKTVKHGCRDVEAVFITGIWLASAPLHEAGKTTKSGNTLKPGIRREELGFASDNLSSDPNACPLISTFSRPHSEDASTTHIPVRRENVPNHINGFRTLHLQGRLPHKYRLNTAIPPVLRSVDWGHQCVYCKNTGLGIRCMKKTES